MFKSLFRRAKPSRASAVYASLVARARHEEFYLKNIVPDTFDGRFELMVMHLYLVHSRLKDGSEEGRRMSQEIFDAFIADMDAGLREAGVGDQTVPKRINKMTRVFYGRTGAYDTIFETNRVTAEELKMAIGRNLYPDDDALRPNKPDERANTLACYMIGEYRRLKDMSEHDIINQALLFSGVPQLNQSGAE